MTSSHQHTPVVHAVWIGDTLGTIGAACLKSFRNNGHHVKLHAYGKITDLPEGVELSDANKIINEREVFRHSASGSYAMFSDIFRYQLLRKEGGIYIDCDIFCIERITIPENEYLFGFEDDENINNAILAMPKKSQLLEALIDTTQNNAFIPPWLKKSKKSKIKIKRALKGKVDKRELPLTTFGPNLVTHFVQKLGIKKSGQPADVFYPVPAERVSMLLDQGLSLTEISTARTKAIHLFNEKLKHHDLRNIPPSSPLGKLISNNKD